MIKCQRNQYRSRAENGQTVNGRRDEGEKKGISFSEQSISEKQGRKRKQKKQKIRTYKTKGGLSENGKNMTDSVEMFFGTFFFEKSDDFFIIDTKIDGRKDRYGKKYKYLRNGGNDLGGNGRNTGCR